MKIEIILHNYILIYFVINCYMTLTFKKEIPNEINSNNFLDFIIENEYYSNIKIGTPYQEIPIKIKFSLNDFMIISNNQKGIFNEKKSTSYHELEKGFETDFKSEYFNKGIISWDNILFDNKIKIFNLTFILGTNIIKQTKGGIIGLKKTLQSSFFESTNFLYLLKIRGIINSYCFLYQYNKNNSGVIIIGNFPHEYNNNTYDKEYFKSVKIDKSYKYINWKIKFDEIKYGNINLNYDLNIEFNCDLGGIIGSEDAFNEIKKNFFDKYIKSNLCDIIYDKKNWYMGFYCDKNIKLEDFSNLSFKSKDFNYTFILNYNDLFIEINNKIYFLMFFRKDSTEYFWIFGEPFFKKYQIIFDEEKGIIGFYISKKNKKNFNTSIIYFIVLIIIIFILIGIIIKIIIKKPRKLRANELEDDYDYLEKINN